MLTNRVIFLDTIINNTDMDQGEYQTLVSSALLSYEEIVAEVSGAGVDIVTKERTMEL